MFYEPYRDIELKVHYRICVNCSAPLHFHQSLELIYCKEGRLAVFCGNSTYTLSDDEIAFIPSCFPHALSTLTSGTRSVTYIIPYPYFKAFEDNHVPLRYEKLDNKVLNRRIGALMDESASAILERQPNLLLQGYIHVILGLIAENYPCSSSEDEKIGLMTDIIAYLYQHSKEPLTLDTIAAHFGYSRFYFSKIFHKTFNCSLNFYLNQIRIYKIFAEAEKGKKMTDVILDNGFRSVSAFYHAKEKLSAQHTDV